MNLKRKFGQQQLSPKTDYIGRENNSLHSRQHSWQPLIGDAWTILKQGTSQGQAVPPGEPIIFTAFSLCAPLQVMSYNKQYLMHAKGNEYIA